MSQQELISPKFSILVPVYNAEQYLDACVQSVLEQTYTQYELILVNDGSTDSSGDICDHYAKEHLNIRVFHKKNQGQLHARQVAIQHAKGDYYIFLDADDTLRKNALHVLLDKFSTYNCDCIIFQYERVWSGVPLSHAPKFADICITDKRELYRKCFLSNAYNSMCRKAVKASLLSGNTDYSAYYHVRFAEDLLQSLEVLQNSQHVVFIDNVLYNYTANPNSITRSVKYENYKIDFSVRMRVASFLRDSVTFDANDMAAYRSYCAKLFCDEVVSICSFAIPVQEKKHLLERLSDTQYYKTFLACGRIYYRNLAAKKIVFLLFRKNLYGPIIALLAVYACVKKLYAALFK